MPRLVWKNEILSSLNGTSEPQYDVLKSDGTVLNSNVKLRLKNPIQIQGTAHDATNMNNLMQFYDGFNFDNMAALAGFTYNVIFNPDESVNETIKHTVSNIILAERLTTFTPNLTIETETLYENTTVHNIVRKTETTTDLTTLETKAVKIV